MCSIFTNALRRIRFAPRDVERRRVTKRRRTLRCEPLEDRRLLATLELDVQLWTVDSNAKGTQIASTLVNGTKEFNVTKGTPFFVQVVINDKRVAPATSAGVIAIPLDLDWNTNTNGQTLLQYADPAVASNSTVPANSPVINPLFNVVRAVNDFNVNQHADQLRGAKQGTGVGVDGCNPSGGKDDCREFSLLKFQGNTVGTSNFVVDLNGSMSFADGAALENDPTRTVIIHINDTTSISLSGYVYADADLDGVRDVDQNGVPIEIGLPNVTITLFTQGSTTPLATTTTGPDGWYHFENLQPGRYRIVETQPAGFLDGQETLGIILPTQQASGTVGNDEFTNIELADNQQGIDYNFAEVFAATSINKRMLLASTPPMAVLVAQRMGVAATAILGTAGNDTITINNNGSSLQVTVNNGPTQTIDLSNNKLLVLDTAGGDDTITINGTSASELAHYQPAYIGLRREDLSLINALGYGILAMNAEHINVNAGTNTGDLAVFEDSPGNDAATASGNLATVNWANNMATAQAQAFGRVRLASSKGGNDTVNEQTHDFVLERLGDWL